MTRILHRMPIASDPVVFRGRPIRVIEPQIIVWISLNLPGWEKWDSQIPRFPAILDTGNTHNFFIGESMLARWAGIRSEGLEYCGEMQAGGHRVTLRRASLCLHSNLPGKRDEFLTQPPVFLMLDKGIAVCDDRHPLTPRMPLLGLRSIINNNLTLRVDGVRSEVSLRSAPPRW